MFGIGQTELIIILVFAFLLFGPDKLPQAGKTIGRAIRQFRETQQKVTNVVQTEVIDPMAAAANASSTAKKAAAADADADADAPADIAAEKVAEARKETFAERRARLAAEKAAAEAAAPEGESLAESSPAAEAGALAATDAAPAVDAAESEAKEAAEASEQKSIANLYARRPRRRATEVEGAVEDGGSVASSVDAVETEDAAPAGAANAEGGEQ